MWSEEVMRAHWCKEVGIPERCEAAFRGIDGMALIKIIDVTWMEACGIPQPRNCRIQRHRAAPTNDTGGRTHRELIFVTRRTRQNECCLFY
jgi:hypothetical protein